MFIERILAFVIVLGILVFVHEFGHFIFARRLGVRVITFSLGFGPKLWGKKVGETEYRVSAVPLGGYVRLFGEDPSEELNPDEKLVSFSHQPLMKRVLIVAAGPFFNLFLAFVIFMAVSMVGVPVLTPEVGGVQENTPAERAGVREGDLILSIEGERISQWEEIRDKLQAGEGREVRLRIKREGKEIETSITPVLKEVQDLLGENRQLWMIGIFPKGNFITKRYDPFRAALIGIQQTWQVTKLTLMGTVRLIQGRIPRDTIGGPILIAQMAGQQASEGFSHFTRFIAVLSINLGILNLFPIPVLDGGHLLFFGIESVLGKPLSLKKREIATQIGLFILISLMIFAVYNDVMRLFIRQG